MKKLSIALLLTLAVGQIASADVRNYRYDGNMPFIKMMLSMMSAMGMIDRVPSNGLYGGNYPQSRWGGQNGRYGSSPFQRSPWMNSPWMNASGLDRYGSAWTDDRWGEPRWGILPVDSYSPYNYSAYGYPRDVSPWSSSELSGWVDEPWETSTWNPDAKQPVQPQSQAQPQAQQPLLQQSAPQQPTQRSQRPSPLQYMVQSPVDNQQYQATPQVDRLPINRPPPNGAPVGRQETNRQNYQRSPLSKLSPSDMPSAYPQRQPQAQYRQYESQGNTPPPSHRSSKQRPRNSVQQKPCITEYCGLKKPNLNGFWVTQDGEMLGIKNNQFLWSDGDKRRLSGLMKIDNEYLVFSVEGSKQLLHFKYKISGNRLLTMQPDGKIREFARMSRDGYFY